MLLFLMTLSAVLVAWWLDHQRLMGLIPAQPQKQTNIFRLQNTDPDLLAAKLGEIFEDENFVPIPKSKSDVVATTSSSDFDKVRAVVQYLDRVGTDLVKVAHSKTETKDESAGH